MSGVASRYQNSLLYDPSMGVGRYPERSAYTMPRASPGQQYGNAPMQFAPAPEYVPTLGSSYGLAASAGGGGGDVNMPSSAGLGAALLPLASRAVSMATQGIGQPPPPSAPFMPGVSVLSGIDALPWLATQPLTIEPPAAGIGTLVDNVGDGFTLTGGATPQPLGDLTFGSAEGLGPTITQPAAQQQSGGLSGFNPATAIAGAAGGYIGGQLGTAAFGPGDPQQRPYTQAYGTLAGGALGGGLAGVAAGAAAGSVVPVVGTLIGALAGAFLGAGAGGSPDYPLGYFGGSVGSDGQFNQDASGALNGGRRWQADAMSNSLFGDLTQRAAADGLSVNPGFVNQQVFTAGFSADDPGSPYFFNVGSRPAAASEKDWRGGSFDQLADFAYGNLRDRGVFAASGAAPSWSDVQANLQAQGDVADYWDNNGEQNNFYQGHGWQQNQYMVPTSSFGLAPPPEGGFYADQYAYGSTPTLGWNPNMDGASGNSG